ncbi:hypothetical protein PR048_004654 [Dryococelus australis]|uniref:Uncharacterized protein n=1 Tax=Dryococelus australis TaxID=614101 RepID=A0ABQ9I5Z7_9NEOP|nr:hypothetical protein PR048_004654 [Dryococelus australis]
MKGWRKLEIPEKTRRSAASSGTIQLAANSIRELLVALVIGLRLPESPVDSELYELAAGNDIFARERAGATAGRLAAVALVGASLGQVHLRSPYVPAPGTPPHGCSFCLQPRRQLLHPPPPHHANNVHSRAFPHFAAREECNRYVVGSDVVQGCSGTGAELHTAPSSWSSAPPLVRYITFYRATMPGFVVGKRVSPPAHCQRSHHCRSSERGVCSGPCEGPYTTHTVAAVVSLCGLGKFPSPDRKEHIAQRSGRPARPGDTTRGSVKSAVSSCPESVECARFSTVVHQQFILHPVFNYQVGTLRLSSEISTALNEVFSDHEGELAWRLSKARKTVVCRDNPTTKGNFRHVFHVRKSGATTPRIEPGSPRRISVRVRLLLRPRGDTSCMCVAVGSGSGTPATRTLSNVKRLRGGTRTGLPTPPLCLIVACMTDPRDRGALPDPDHDGNTARLALRSDKALGLRVRVARIAPSLVDLGRLSLWNQDRRIGDPESRNSVCATLLHWNQDQTGSWFGTRIIRSWIGEDVDATVCPLIMDVPGGNSLDSHSGGPGFDSRSGHPDFGFPWFPEIAPGECWDRSLTKAMADSFPILSQSLFPVQLAQSLMTSLSTRPSERHGLSHEAFGARFCCLMIEEVWHLTPGCGATPHQWCMPHHLARGTNSLCRYGEQLHTNNATPGTSAHSNRIQSPAGPIPFFSLVGIVTDDASGRRVFLGNIPFPPAFSFRRCSIPSITLVGSQDLATNTCTIRLESRISLPFTSSAMIPGLRRVQDFNEILGAWIVNIDSYLRPRSLGLTHSATPPADNLPVETCEIRLAYVFSQGTPVSFPITFYVFSIPRLASALTAPQAPSMLLSLQGFSPTFATAVHARGSDLGVEATNHLTGTPVSPLQIFSFSFWPSGGGGR